MSEEVPTNAVSLADGCRREAAAFDTRVRISFDPGQEARNWNCIPSRHFANMWGQHAGDMRGALRVQHTSWVVRACGDRPLHRIAAGLQSSMHGPQPHRPARDAFPL